MESVQDHAADAVAYAVSGQAVRVSPEIRVQRGIFIDDPITAQAPIAQPQPVSAPIPTTRDYLVSFYEAFHGHSPDSSFIDSLPLSDKIAAKELIANYQPPRADTEEDMIDLPDSEDPNLRDIMDQIRYHENELSNWRERIRFQLEPSRLPQISVTRIKEDFSDFWDANITGNLELELTSKYDCKLSHSFKERPDSEERTILVNLGKYKFTFRLSDLSFIRCKPVSFVTSSSTVSHPHPHVSNYICWGTQSEVAQDAIVRKDFKAFSRLLFQAINNYNHSSTFCSLLRYKVHLGDFSGETLVFRGMTSYRHVPLSELPKGIHLSSISSTDGEMAYVIKYRRYMPYLNYYLNDHWFKVAKSVSETGFIRDERDIGTNRPTYQLVDEADIQRIIAKRGSNNNELGF